MNFKNEYSLRMKKNLKAGLVGGLAALLIGCSSGKQSISITPQNKINVFGGIKEEYKPTIIRYEAETQKDGYSTLVSSYLGISSDEYTIPRLEVCAETPIGEQCAIIREEEKTYIPSLIFGIDTGIKQEFWDFFYHKMRLGLAYISKEFDDHEFQNNFHLGYELGIENNEFSFGFELNHWSTGNKVFGWNSNKRNSGINAGGLKFGLKF
jgi:hypothetical protein